MRISISEENLDLVYLINGTTLKTEKISMSDLNVKPSDYYMIINVSRDKTIEVIYDEDISLHEIVYDPCKEENAPKELLKEDYFLRNYEIPDGYIDTLPKWYSFKFTYEDFNLIFIKPDMGLSFQRHKLRTEHWKILSGKPIIICNKKVNYFVEPGSEFNMKKNQLHTIINPHLNNYVLLKENWTGEFDENDIERLFNPNNYV